MKIEEQLIDLLNNTPKEELEKAGLYWIHLITDVIISIQEENENEFGEEKDEESEGEHLI